MRGMWNLHSLIRDRTHAPSLHWEHGVLSIGPPGKSCPLSVFLNAPILHSVSLSLSESVSL